MTVRRPATVSVAFGLQLAAVAALLISVASAIAYAIYYDGLIDQAAALTRADPGEVSSERTFNLQGAVMTVVPAFVSAVGFAATAVPVRRGSNIARILACVAAGFLMLGCCLTPLLSVPMSIMAEDVSVTEGSAFYDKLWELDTTSPASVLLFMPIDDLAGITLAIAVGVLLLLPPSNRFFRGEPEPPPRPPLPAYPIPPAVYYWQPPMPPWSAPPPPSTPPDSPPPSSTPPPEAQPQPPSQ